MQQQNLWFRNCSFLDMAHACVETFQHSQIIATVHCGPFRNKLTVDNSGNIQKKDQHCLDRRFCNRTFFCRREFVPHHSMLCSFVSRPNFQHQLSSPVTVLCHTSRTWSTHCNNIQSNAHSVQQLRSVTQTSNKSSFPANLFSKFAWPLSYRLQDLHRLA